MKKLVSLTISLIIMGVIFKSIDVSALIFYLRKTHLGYLAGGLLFFIPQMALFAFRWQRMTTFYCKLSFIESLKLIFACSSLNLLLPSKAGDFSKAFFLKSSGLITLKRAVNLVLFERYLDVLTLCLFALIGLVTIPPGLLNNGLRNTVLLILILLVLSMPLAWICSVVFRNRFISFRNTVPLAKVNDFLHDMYQYLRHMRESPTALFSLGVLSVLIWNLQIFQFYLLFKALHADVSLLQVFQLAPLAIFAGLVPFTVAGIGTRDAALIYFFHSYAPMSLIAGVGVFATLRYILPGLIGLPWLHAYMAVSSFTGEKEIL